MHSWLDTGLTLTVVGITIVFAVQATIALVVWLIGKLDDRWQHREKALDEVALTRTPTIDETTLVLIAAAVATVVRGRYQIRSVRRLLPADAPSSAWSSQGRAVLQGSHVVTKTTH